MGRVKLFAGLFKAGAAGALVVGLGACSYDYLQNTDKVSMSAGDAVKANIEGQTIDPSNDHQYDVSKLGEDGQVVGPDTDPAPTP